MKLLKSVLFGILVVGIISSVIINCSAQTTVSVSSPFAVQFDHEGSVVASVFENTEDNWELVFVNSEFAFNSSINLGDLQDYMDENYHIVCPIPHNLPFIVEYNPVLSGLSYMLVALRNSSTIIDYQSEFMIRSDVTIHTTELMNAEGGFTKISQPAVVTVEQDSSIYGTIFRVDLFANGKVYHYYGIEPLQEHDIRVRFNIYDLEPNYYSCFIRIYWITPSGEVFTRNSEPFGIDVQSGIYEIILIGIAIVTICTLPILYIAKNVRIGTKFGVKHWMREKLKLNCVRS